MSEKSPTRVTDVMTPDPTLIDGLATIRQALNTMKDKGLSSLVIDRRDHDDEYGLITVRDIAEKVIGQNRSPDRVSVYEVMTKPVLTLEGRMVLRYAVRLLTRLQSGRALVIDKSELKGIVTLRDMTLRYVSDEDAAD
ncbi:MAG: CBS domain-containing protein [Hyphomicrobiaceae bacterium]|nr:CBS domain-containing protein [Hyphomicrobiaceae bacterium]MCC0007115.1 CBS domain-containing protein [Hyphomicrobiaceae bacterium]